MGLFSFGKKDKQSYYLDNIIEAQKEHGPRKFLRPTDNEIDRLKVGDEVRLFFVFNFKTDDGCRAERMWVEITDISKDGFKGRLTNTPVYIKDISKGDIVGFLRENIATVTVKLNFDIKKKALISKRAIEKAEVNWALKDEPNNADDSGWQLFYGNEDDDYNSDASNITIVTLEYAMSIEPHLEEVFSSDHNAFDWNEEEMKFIEVHNGIIIS